MRMPAVFVLFLSLSTLLTSPWREQAVGAEDHFRVYIGTYTQGTGSQGIYLLDLNAATGVLTPQGVAGSAVNPSFLAFHPTEKYLYAVGEVSTVEGKKGGGVSAFSVDPGTGKLTLLNQGSSVGAGPCHIVVDRAGRNALVANYGGGSTACLPIGRDGKVSKASTFIQHTGSSVNKQRQEAPHAHSINLDSGNNYAFVADLGLDKILIYRFDSMKGLLTTNDPAAASVAPGAGPRHFAFHPTGKYAYVINEIANTVTAFAYDAAQGKLTELQTIGTLPGDFKGTSHTAEVQVHPSGKFLYGSNRGHDSLAVFQIDPSTGQLTAAGHQTGIRTPRNFGIDPSGRILLAAHQAGNKVQAFKIDPQTGNLSAVGEGVAIPAPVCVKMIAVTK